MKIDRSKIRKSSSDLVRIDCLAQVNCKDEQGQQLAASLNKFMRAILHLSVGKRIKMLLSASVIPILTDENI